MTATLIDGKAVAATVREEAAARAAAIAGRGRSVGLATVLVGSDAASEVYVRNKRRTAEKAGIKSIHVDLSADITQEALLAEIKQLNQDDEVDAYLVQLPLPDGLDADEVVRTIDPAKDADGLHPYNLGLLAMGTPGLTPCTPTGVMRLLDHYDIETSGKRAIVIGRSNLVGVPVALMLAARGVDATVTLAHSRTNPLADLTRDADIVVAAVGVPGLVKGDMIKPGAAVIDVGINRTEGGLVGDVDFDEVAAVAGWLTPVPGGVGPMTVAHLMLNAVRAAELR